MDPCAKQMPTAAREAWAFWRMRRASLGWLARQAARVSRVQAVSVAFASGLLWCTLFYWFFHGFSFIQASLVHPGLRTQLIHAIFNLFFLALTIMLFLSSAIITYGTMYRGGEVAFLLSQPVRVDRIALFKFQETLFFSCWGFVLLGSPMLLAYGLVMGSPWYFYLLLGPFVLAFVFLPAAGGAIACFLFVRCLPALRMHAVYLMAFGCLLAAGALGWRILANQEEPLLTANWFQGLLSRMEFSQQRLLPNWWLSSGLLEAAHPARNADGPPSWLESLLFLAVLSSNGMLLRSILGWVATKTLRAGFSRLVGLAPSRQRNAAAWPDRIVAWLLRPLPRELRQFVQKDFRIFRRDPAQWLQVGIFLGLLCFYFLNIRTFEGSGGIESWILIMSFMNLAVIGLILSTFTTRFIFPMISLEGRRFWVLATAPIRRDSVLWGKFLFACLGSLPVCAALVLASDLTLGVATRMPWLIAIHQLSCWSLCAGLAALAVGLGACFPNLREPSPAKIAAGVGGTINLLLSSLYILSIVLITAIPCVVHSWPSVQTGWWNSFGIGTTTSIVAAVLATIVIATAATVLPLRSGLRRFRELEG